ncbi:MAG: hypothetical protein L0Z62_16360 [Gemmataceae bacterium]|nr:hypothetical protein [Gemmataceae bacterium]
MSTQAPPTPRHAFGWPAGSVRALLVLIVVVLVCSLTLLSYGRVVDPIPIPPYLIYLLLMAVGYYFAARGHGTRDPGVPQPLWLPRGSIRLLLLAALTATFTWRALTDQAALESQLIATFKEAEKQPLLPLIVLAGFFVGALLRALILGRSERSYWALNIEAWFALIALLLLCVDVLIRLVINPSLTTPLELPHWEGLLAGLVTFYFGVRS